MGIAVLLSKGEHVLLLWGNYSVFLITKQCRKTFWKLVTLAREKISVMEDRRQEEVDRNSELLRSVRRTPLAFPEQVKGLMRLAMNLTCSTYLAFHLCCARFPLTPALWPMLIDFMAEIKFSVCINQSYFIHMQLCLPCSVTHFPLCHYRGIPTVPGTVTLKKDSQNLIGISIGGGAQYCPCLYIVQVGTQGGRINHLCKTVSISEMESIESPI